MDINAQILSAINNRKAELAGWLQSIDDLADEVKEECGSFAELSEYYSETFPDRQPLTDIRQLHEQFIALVNSVDQLDAAAIVQGFHSNLLNIFQQCGDPQLNENTETPVQAIVFEYNGLHDPRAFAYGLPQGAFPVHLASELDYLDWDLQSDFIFEYVGELDFEEAWKPVHEFDWLNERCTLTMFNYLLEFYQMHSFMLLQEALRMAVESEEFKRLNVIHPVHFYINEHDFEHLSVFVHEG